MAPSLQELIDFLLNEVALCGNQGTALSEVLKSIDTFYQAHSGDSQLQQTVDRPFKVKVWSWLTRNPEVSVGRNGEWNSLSLDEAEELDTQFKKSSQAGNTDESQDGAPPGPSSQFRIFVSTERMWFAIAGHEPDDNKVPNSEFALLSIIASHGANGVAQTELVKLSGQDKRSVPKRTDALVRKGYIEKRAIQIKAARTSLCTLRRFSQSVIGEANDQNSQDRPMIDFAEFINNLFEILKKYSIITRNDLKRKLDFNDNWRWRILSRALRKFERIGVIKRVRAQSQYDRLHPCVMLLREPTERDMEKFHDYSRNDIIKSDGDTVELDDDMEMDDVGQATHLGAEEDEVVVKQEENIVDAGRTIPAWTPDRIAGNQLFELIDRAGTTGITNANINRVLFGSFYRRPSESILHRLTDCWQLSQPLHVRHLAVVRDTAIERTVFYYINYSARNFAKMVEAGHSSWEAVEFAGSKKGKANNARLPPPDAKPQLDQYGLPTVPPIYPLMKNGAASLFECVAACRPSNYLLSSADPKAFQLFDGTFAVQSGPRKILNGNVIQSPIPSGHAGRPKGSLNRSTRIKMANRTPQSTETRVIEEPPEAMDFTPSRTVRSKRWQVEGLSKKERFEARGMDETWTEYNVMIMDRPTAGVYVTPQGKRRPAGRKQGRPKQSRIAVFKSDKLASFPWFVEDFDDSDNDNTIGASAPASVVRENTPTTLTPSIDRRSKRPQAALDQTESPTPSTRSDAGLYRGRNAKRSRTDANENDQTESGDTEASLRAGQSTAQERAASTNGRDKSAAVHPLSVEVDQEATSKRRRMSSPDRLHVEAASSEQPSGSVEHSKKSAKLLDLSERMSRQPTLSVAPDSPKSVKRHAAADRGGSISLIRRKIIMELVEKAGGAYPSGNEIWYPFVTYWMKFNRKERPDMRTIKTAIKNIVDSGKLRQLTFSGKDIKGVMVTRTILAKPDMSPNDSLIKDMQQQVLATDPRNPRISYSPHVEVDPVLIRTNVPITQRFKLPVVASATVQLHHKPAFALYEEKRQERQVNKALMKQLEGDLESGKSKRLLTTQRRLVQNTSGATHTSISRPGPRPRGRPRIERPVKIISAIGSTSLLMNPGQTFHPQSGTFATGARLSRSRQLKNKPLPMLPIEIANSVQHLTQLARQTEDPSRVSDRILKWELNHEEFFDAILEHHPYVDQAVDQNTFHAAPIEGNIRFALDQPTRASQAVRQPNEPRRARRSFKQSAPRQRRLDAVDTSLDARKETQRDAFKAPLRRQRITASVPDALYRKVMAAIVVVRVLAGGWEARMVDWDLVSAAFPFEDPIFIQDRAKSILSNNRLQILKMQRDFQERFLEAYKKGRVPTIDYSNLEAYNWPAVVEWANIELDVTTSQKAPSLPATREQFDSIFELREDPVTNGDELFGTTSMITTVHKRALTARVPFAIPIHTKKAPTTGPRKAELASLEVAKSWVRANIVTPEQAYRPEEARDTLSRFGGPLVESATQSLLTERVIGMGNRGRIVPGRNYDITDHLLQQINRKRTIECTILRRAVHFKTTVLDPQLQNGDSGEVKYTAEDGDILALINLSAAGYITFKPRDPPRDKWGLLDGSGYLTRQMDKNKLRFAIDVYPTPSYIYGNPVQPKVQAVGPPASPVFPSDSLPQKVPLWFDIHGDLIPHIWDMAIASAIGCVAIREGASAETISGMIKPALGAWEIELLMSWLADVGVVCRVETGGYTGWKVLEFWWMILG
ncbi:hypothetical protein N7526_009308 [Penicillium atrosanguineum]|nr:hypothetical protein N7526_009308 [Penicillium atrosanguineum]